MARRSRPGRTRPGRTTARPPPSAARGGPLRAPGSRPSPLRGSRFPRTQPSPARRLRLTPWLIPPRTRAPSRHPRLSSPSAARRPGQPRRRPTQRRRSRPEQAGRPQLTRPHHRGGPRPQRAGCCRPPVRRPRFPRVAVRRRRMGRCRRWIRRRRCRPGPVRRPRPAGARCLLRTRRRRSRHGVASWARREPVRCRRRVGVRRWMGRCRPPMHRLRFRPGLVQCPRLAGVRCLLPTRRRRFRRVVVRLGPTRRTVRCRPRTGRRGGRLSPSGGGGVRRQRQRRRYRRAGPRRLAGGRRPREGRRRLRRSRPARRRSCRPQDRLPGARLGGMSLVPKPGRTRPARALCVLPWRGRTRAA
jgi:hypothetical protein